MNSAKQTITSKAAPAAVGPYSQAIRVDRFVFTSGQLPLDPASGSIVGETAAEQAVQVFENLTAVLTAAESSLENLVKVTCFLTDIGDFAAVNEVFVRFLGADYPARSCVEVSRLPKDVKVEIEAVGLCKETA